MRRYTYWTIYLTLIMISLFAKSAIESVMSRPALKEPPLTLEQAKYHRDSLQLFNLGFANALAALQWVGVLQDSEHKPIGAGEVSWEFAQINSITDLDPNFSQAYAFGGVFLSVFKMDKPGAKTILEKWVKRHPSNWQAHYLLGYHLFAEMGDYKEGGNEILKAAAMEGAPFWLSSLGIRLLSQTGAIAQAFKVSLSLYSGLRSEGAKYRMKARLRSLNFALQKASWEKALLSYREEKKREPSDLRELRPWLASEIRQVASLINEEVNGDLNEIVRETFSFRYDANKKQIVANGGAGISGLEKIGIYTNDPKEGKR